MKRWGLMAWLCAVATGFAAGAIVPIPISVNSTGFVSLALIDTNGVLVRTLAYAESVSSGTRNFFWDGTTDLGLPAPAGTYTTRAVFFTKSPTIDYVMKVGTSGNPPWRRRNLTGDWGGDLGGPSTICANRSSLMLVWSAVENYTLPGIQQIDTNGNVQWSYISFYPYDGRMAGAMDETNLFLGILNRSAQRIEIAKYGLGTSNKSIIANLPTPPHYTLSGRWKNRWQAMLDGMAITPTRIFANVSADDRLFILDRSNGAILQTVPLPSPRGLAVSGGRLLVVSSNSVLALTFDGAVETNLIESAVLSDPYAIAVDASGNIYISDGGSQRLDPEKVTGNHQIHVFDPTGAYLRSIGAPGGSPRSGFINRHGFGDIRSICIGPDSKLWVNENITGFKRTSRWNTNGVLEREWFQRKLTHYADLINPARPDELVYAASAHDDYPALTAHRVNWVDGTWEPLWSYALNQDEMYQEDVYLSNDHSHPIQELQPGKRQPVFHYEPSELVTFEGRHYFMNHGGNGDGAIFMYSDTNKPQPVALIGFHRVDIITNRIVSYYDTGPNRWFTWSDKNRDGRMAMVECAFANPPSLELSKRIIEARLETNLNIRLLRPVGSNALAESVLPLKQLSNGVPIYSWALLEDMAYRQMPRFNGGDGWKTVSRVNDDWVPIEAEGAEYTLIDPATSLDLNLPSLDHFWADRNWRKRIAKFEGATGKFLWAVGRRAPARAVPGEMYNPFGISFSHDTIFAADVLGMVWLWSKDGLYLGRLLHDAEPGRPWDEFAIHAEIQGPVTLFTNEATGKLMMIVNDTGAHVYEVTLPTLEPLTPATVTLTSEAAALALPWDPDSPPPIAGSLLNVRLTNGLAQISWHMNAASMTLESAATPSGPWTGISIPRTTNGENVSVSVTTVGRRFYRLRK